MSSVNQQLYDKHKQLFTSVVMPVIMLTTIMMILIHARWDWKFGSGLLVTLLLDVFNIYYSTKNRFVKTPWGTFESRSDGFDTFRWCINLPLDLYIVWSLEMSFASASFGWLILTFGALFEVFRGRNRRITFGVALSCFIALVIYYTEGLLQGAYVVSCYIGLMFILFKFEEWLLKEMNAFYEEEQKRRDLEAESEIMRRESLIGSKTRMICHEINNLFSVMQLSVAGLNQRSQNMPADVQKSIQRMGRAVNSLGRLSSVILDEIGNIKSDATRWYQTRELLTDFDTLLTKHFTDQKGMTFHFSVEKEVQNGLFEFEERTGAAYLIVHNLVKNASEACRSPKKQYIIGQVENDPTNDAKVTMHCSLENTTLEICIADNGPGMSQTQVDAIVQGQAITTKSSGHGLGTRFVFDQVAKNKFSISIESNLGVGTTIKLKIPLREVELPSQEPPQSQH